MNVCNFFHLILSVRQNNAVNRAGQLCILFNNDANIVSFFVFFCFHNGN